MVGEHAHGAVGAVHIVQRDPWRRVSDDRAPPNKIQVFFVVFFVCVVLCACVCVCGFFGGQVGAGQTIYNRTQLLGCLSRTDGGRHVAKHIPVGCVLMPRNRRPRPRLLDQQVRAPAQHVRADLPPRGAEQQRVRDQLPEPLAALAPGR